MTARIINVRMSKSGKRVGYAVINPSIEAFMLGGKARLVRFMADEKATAGTNMSLEGWTVGQTDTLPPRNDGKPSSFSEITWLDKA